MIDDSQDPAWSRLKTLETHHKTMRLEKFEFYELSNAKFIL